ncbi:MAG: hypothetical protein FWC50_15690 [Planctomycetaceae bacterium]|nr:hypothetical protein [Planctomycetaceae bacterium]
MNHTIRIKVLQSMQGDLEYFPWSEKINRSYCERHGYEYVVSRDEPRRDRHVNWQKIIDIMQHLNDCDYLLFMDADAHFYSHELKIEEELIPLMNEKEILMAQDIGDESSRWHPSLPNAGVILMKTDEKTREFFKFWDRCPELNENCRWDWPPLQLGLWCVVLPNFPGSVQIHSNYYMIQGRYGQYIRHYVSTPNEERTRKMREFCEQRNIK